MNTSAIEGTTREVIASGVATVLSAADAMPRPEMLQREIEIIERASARRYFLPDEEEWVKVRYSQYLTIRSSLLETIHEIGGMAGHGRADWSARAHLFSTAFAADCILMRANRFIIDIAKPRSVLWQKLDEEDIAAGIPKKSFTSLYRAFTSTSNQFRYLAATEFYFRFYHEITRHAEDPLLRPIIELLAEEEPFMERSTKKAVKRGLAYGWFSFLRRNRSAWKKTMGSLFEASGRAVAELRQPGIKQSGTPKRIHNGLCAEILSQVRPGDVFITRHDDALSNLFLPGYWPHAALYIGKSEDLKGEPLPPSVASEDHWFLEAKKDGVLIRPAEETMEVDALIVLRPPLQDDSRQKALERALSHRGKPYDFVFDFRTADKLVCTEVVYRGYHGVGPIDFHLHETGGRLCLPAEALIDQATECGFELVLTAGVHGDRILTGELAESALQATRIE